MKDEDVRRRDEAELARRIRAERTFTLEEAIGRMAGPGAMKGASPVDRRRQAAAVIGAYLGQHLVDGAGALRSVLLRQVSESELLLKNLEAPLGVLGEYVRRVLGSEYRLKELVREADVEWGRVFGERPYFEREGGEPAAEDPYTVQEVRGVLERLEAGLGEG